MILPIRTSGYVSVRGILILLLFLTPFKHMVFGQEHLLCKQPVVNIKVKNQVQQLKSMQRSAVVEKLIRVYFHICRNDDGTNAAVSLSQIYSEFDILVSDYANGDICFALMGIDFVDDTDVNAMDITDDEVELSSYFIPGCLNIFYHRSLMEGTTTWDGYAYEIPGIFLSMSSGGIGQYNLISHEVGHCLGLLHTFETEDGAGYIDGTNCTTSGDCVCDTNADPWGGGACFTYSDCAYTGTCTDPSGATSYSPPYSNIMSYWGLAGCTLNTLTPEQFDRCHDYLDTSAILENIQSSPSLLYESTTVASGYVMISAINDLSTSGVVILSNSVEATLCSRSVSLTPGFSAQPTSGIVRVRPTICDY